MANTIPASAIVSVQPSVLSAGGTGLTLSGLILSNSTRTPIGQMLAFGSALSVSDYYGANSTEYFNATNYFAGFINSNQRPSNLWITQYNQSAVPAYVRGASTAGIALATLQSYSGTLIVVVEGVTKTSASISLATATSPSSAAVLMQAGFTGANLYDGITSSASTIAAGTATNCTAGSIAGYTLTVGGSVTGAFVVGGKLSGTGVTTDTEIVRQLTGSAGGAGTYVVDKLQTVTSTTITQTYGLLTIAAMSSGTMYLGSVISGGTTAAGSRITAQVSGTTGGLGTYVVSGGAQTVTATTISSGPLAVSYDSVSGGYVITGGAPGSQGTIGYVSGTLAANILMTLVTGAVLSQGADASIPSTFMNAIVNQNTNWFSFMANFDVDNGYGNATKQLFAAWNNAQNNLYEYVVVDTDVTPTLSTTATLSLGYILTHNDTSGTVCIWDDSNSGLDAFKCGLSASINFNQTNGRATSAFKSQAGITPSVTSLSVYNNLKANGYNCYGAFATAAQQFEFYGPGTVTGSFRWDDSYTNQVWLNTTFQLNFMDLLTQVYSIPYNSTGYALMRAAILGTIQLALTNGVISTGVPLSTLQIAEVNNSAGLPIDKQLSANGWYLQILPASAPSRAARTSPPATFWYMDGGSVQQISLNSVEVQ